MTGWGPGAPALLAYGVAGRGGTERAGDGGVCGFWAEGWTPLALGLRRNNVVYMTVSDSALSSKQLKED